MSRANREVARAVATALLSYLPWLIAAGLAVHLALLMARFGSRVPRADAWFSLPSTLSAYERGDSIWATLWLPHNTSRIPWVRLLDLATVRFAAGDLRVELFVGFVLGCAGGLLVAHKMYRQLLPLHPRLAPWIYPTVAVLALNPSQMEVWISTIGVTELLNNVAVFGGFILLSRSPLSAWQVGLGAGSGLIASGSYVSGLLFWPVALISLLGQGGRRAIPAAIAWTALSILVWLAYLGIGVQPSFGMGGPPHPQAFIGSMNLPGLAWFFATVLGNPIGAALRPQDAATSVVVPLIGALGLAVLAVCAWRVHRTPSRRPDLWLWLAIAVHTMITAATMAVSRLHMGWFLPFSSRYITHMWPFWASVVALFLLATAPDPGRSREASRWTHVLSNSVIAGFLAWMLLTLNTAVQRWTAIERDRAAAAAELPDVCLGNAEVIGRMGSPDQVAEALPLLTRHGVLTFPLRPLALPGGVRPAASAGAIDSVRLEPNPPVAGGGRCLRLSGWAREDRQGAPARQVLLVQGGRVLKQGWAGERRPHVGKDYDEDSRRADGWTLYIDTRRLAPQGELLEVYAIFEDAQQPALLDKVVLNHISGWTELQRKQG